LVNPNPLFSSIKKKTKKVNPITRIVNDLTIKSTGKGENAFASIKKNFASFAV
jgi:hypothetical protein